MRKRDIITGKLKNKIELSKSEKRMWEKKTTSHIWSQCPDLKQCVNQHCWRAQKTQECDKCKLRTSKCICTLKLTNLRCQNCEETSRNCRCDLPKERDIQTELTLAMGSYKGKEKIKSIGQLISVMNGNGISDQRCVFDNKLKKWVEKRFEPLPTGIFEWECLNSGTLGETEFVMDSGSQLNILPMSEIRSQGIKVSLLPQIDLDVQGIGGSMS